MSYFHIIEQTGRITDDAYVSSSSPDGGTGGEVCRIRLHLVALGTVVETGPGYLTALPNVTANPS